MHDRIAAWRDRARVLASMPAVGADRGTRRTLLKLTRRGGGGEASEGATVPVRIRALGGRTVHIRPGTSDIDVIADDFIFRHQLPPRELHDRPLTRIWELGTNIGVGLADLAVRNPDAVLFGVEPDRDNVELAHRNLDQFGDRCRLINCAIWDTDTELVVEGDEAYGLTVRPVEAADAGRPTVRALSLNTLLSEHDPEATIDYLLMDIEGTERRVLARDTEWAARVEAIKVELHPETGYSAEDCAADLTRLGFRTRMEPLWWGGFVVGLRQRSDSYSA